MIMTLLNVEISIICMMLSPNYYLNTPYRWLCKSDILILSLNISRKIVLRKFEKKNYNKVVWFSNERNDFTFCLVKYIITFSDSAVHKIDSQRRELDSV